MTDDELDAMIERGRNYVGGLRGENELTVGPAMSSYAIEQLVSGVEALRAERDRLRAENERLREARDAAKEDVGRAFTAATEHARRAMIDAAGEDKA